MKKSGPYYVCSECDMKYNEKMWAKKCEDWCKKYKSCNIDIMKHRV